MFCFPRAQVHPIGLDIGHDSIKMMQLARDGKSLSVYAAAIAPLPAEARTHPHRHLPLAINAIRQVLRQRQFQGRKVVVALPRKDLHIRNLRLPQGSADADSTNVQIEAQAILPIDVDQSQVQFLQAGEARDAGVIRDEIIVMAALNKDVAAFIDVLSCAGIELAALDSEPCALYRLVDRFIRRRDDEVDAHVVVDVGWERSQIVIGKGRQLSVIRAIEVGGRHFQEAVSQKLGITLEEAQTLRRRLMDPAANTQPFDERDPVRQAAADACRSAMQELAREISLCLRYHAVTFRGRQPARVRLVGGEAADPQLRSVLNKLLPIPCRAAQPLQSVDTSSMGAADRNVSMSQWGMAFGLALRCTEGPFAYREGRPRETLLAHAQVA